MDRDETAAKAGEQHVTTSGARVPASVRLPGIPSPVIVDLGSKSKKAIRKLKKGRGKLMDDVEDAIEQVRSNLPEGDRQKQIIPVLVIYRRKRRSGRGRMPSLPFSPLSMFR